MYQSSANSVPVFIGGGSLHTFRITVSTKYVFFEFRFEWEGCSPALPLGTPVTLYRKRIAVYYDIHIKQINALCAQNVECFCIKLVGV